MSLFGSGRKTKHQPSCLSSRPTPPATAHAWLNLSTSVSTDWLFTARPRVGFAWNHTLLYATGGFAITRGTFMQSYSDNVVANEAVGVENSSVSGTLLGWTVGAGVEHALTNHWSIRIGFSVHGIWPPECFRVLHDGIPTDFSNFTNNAGHLTASTVSFGANYKF